MQNGLNNQSRQCRVYNDRNAHRRRNWHLCLSLDDAVCAVLPAKGRAITNASILAADVSQVSLADDEEATRLEDGLRDADEDDSGSDMSCVTSKKHLLLI